MTRFRRRKRRERESNSKGYSGKTSTGASPASAVAQLQGQFGNGAIQRMYQSGLLQAKLEKGVVQRQGEEDEPIQKQAEEEEAVQGKFIQRQEMEEEVKQKKEEEEEPVQKKDGTGQGGSPSPNQAAMPANLRSGLEALSGYDLSSVRVYYNSPKPAQLKAHAYTQGKDIHVAPGQEKHLPHEGWHVVQQAQGKVKPTVQMAGAQINDNAGLEKEADLMGKKAFLAGQRTVQRAGPPASASNILFQLKKETVLQKQDSAEKKEKEAERGGTGGASGSVIQAKLKIGKKFLKTAPNRDKSKMGLGEKIKLTSKDDGSAQVGEISGNAPVYKLETGSGTLTNDIYKATKAEAVKFSVKRQGEPNSLKDTLSMTAIKPNDATMHKNGNRNSFFDSWDGPSAHTGGWKFAGSGFWGIPEIKPDTVSWQNLKWREDGGTKTATGAYSSENNLVHSTGVAHSIDANNKMVPHSSQPKGDDVRSMGIWGKAGVQPFVAGHADWPIKWQVKRPGGSWFTFITVHHVDDQDTSGKVTTSKQGATHTRTAS